MEDLRKNAEGYSDPTAYEAIKRVADSEKEKFLKKWQDERDADYRFRKLLDTIFSICELSGFHIEGRIVVKDKKTGKIWR